MCRKVIFKLKPHKIRDLAWSIASIVLIAMHDRLFRRVGCYPARTFTRYSTIASHWWSMMWSAIGMSTITCHLNMGPWQLRHWEKYLEQVQIRYTAHAWLVMWWSYDLGWPTILLKTTCREIPTPCSSTVSAKSNFRRLLMSIASSLDQSWMIQKFQTSSRCFLQVPFLNVPVIALWIDFRKKNFQCWESNRNVITLHNTCNVM